MLSFVQKLQDLGIVWDVPCCGCGTEYLRSSMQTHPTPGCPGGCPVALEVGHLKPLITPLGNEVGVQRDAKVLVVHLKQKTHKFSKNERVWNCMQFYDAHTKKS